MLDSDDVFDTSAQTAETTPAPKRRRSASRPAGPPAPVVAPEPEPQQDVLLEVTEEAVAPTEEIVEEAAPEDVAEEVVSEEVVSEEIVPETEAVPQPEPESRPKRTRRPRVAASEPPAPMADVVTEPAADGADAPAAAEPTAPARRTRRRAAQPAEAPGDEVAASLAELAREAERRTPRGGDLAHSLGLDVEVDPGAVLDSLAAAIGGMAAPAEDAEEDEDTDDEALVAEGEEGIEGDESPRRRRRRRGGRRRRRGPGEERAESDAEADSEDAAEGDEPSSGGESEPVAPEAAETSATRRRRRRRRRGEDAGDAEDETVDVVVRVREPRRRGSVSDEVTGIEGSTRMEAKKQRRREGRAAGRRRTPILSESEFLARRESVDRKMLIRQTEDYSQIAVLEDGILVEHYVDRDSAASMIGNIYLGRVQNVLPSMEAAFVDIGRGRNAVLYAGEVDWDSFGVTSADKKVEKVFKSGQSVLVQVSKDPVGAKGARLTSHLSIPGRYIVYSPGGHLSGISRKLPENERKRLKGILDELIEPEASVIVRTAAEGASEEELVRDVNRLKAQWEVLDKKAKTSTAPQLLYAEPDLTVRIVRDLFTEDFGSLVIDGNETGEDAYETVDAYLKHVAPHLADRIERWDRAANGDIFDSYRVHEQVSKALERKVFLPSGGSLIIDRTEAMTVIDVNTGKFTGTSGNLEATVTSNNLEAAEEIVRQLRLRDIGGIIVIDFIDMVLPANRELLLRRLVECLGRDRTRHQVAEVTSLGLVQMTRKKIGTGLAEAFTVACETCHGRGYHVHDAPVASQAPADGGDRESRRGRASGAGSTPARRTTRSRKPAEPKPEAPEAKPEPVAESASEPAPVG